LILKARFCVIFQENSDQEIAVPLAICLCQVLIQQFNNNLFPVELDEEYVSDSTIISYGLLFFSCLGHHS
jgi:hypothetical protein